jgi:hypothetical protein
MASINGLREGFELLRAQLDELIKISFNLKIDKLEGTDTSGLNHQIKLSITNGVPSRQHVI